MKSVYVVTEKFAMKALHKTFKNYDKMHQNHCTMILTNNVSLCILHLDSSSKIA